MGCNLKGGKKEKAKYYDFDLSGQTECLWVAASPLWFHLLPDIPLSVAPDFTRKLTLVAASAGWPLILGSSKNELLSLYLLPERWDWLPVNAKLSVTSQPPLWPFQKNFFLFYLCNHLSILNTLCFKYLDWFQFFPMGPWLVQIKLTAKLYFCTPLVPIGIMAYPHKMKPVIITLSFLGHTFYEIEIGTENLLWCQRN